MRSMKEAQLLIWAIAHRALAQTATLPCVAPDTLDECTTTCLSAITQFNACNGLQDCICALVEEANSDLAACLSCALYYPTVESLVTDTIGDSLLGCTYTTPVLGQCSSTVSLPSVSATVSVSASATISLSASISVEPTGELPTCVSLTLDECTTTCAAAITSFNACAGVSDCICALEEDANSDLSACLLCVEIYPTVQPMINDVIGDALQVCDYTLPTLSACSIPSTAVNSAVPTGTPPACVSLTEQECTDTCTSAITSFNGCAGLSDCFCALVEDVNSDLSACLLCVEIYPTVQPMINDVIGNALEACDYTLPTISACGSSTSPVPSSTPGPASTSILTSGPGSSATTPVTPGTTTTVLPPPPPPPPSTPSSTGNAETITTTVEAPPPPPPMESSSTLNAAAGTSGHDAGATTVAPVAVQTVAPNAMSSVAPNIVSSVAPNIVSSVAPNVVSSMASNVISSVAPNAMSSVAPSVVPSGGNSAAGTQGSETVVEQTNGANEPTYVSATLISVLVILAML
uniref:ARAD1D46508p n=1 Tax=Blastobotrys adeninivorans TaxID=409370 RepID=A0A060TDS9_BLAAD